MIAADACDECRTVQFLRRVEQCILQCVGNLAVYSTYSMLMFCGGVFYCIHKSLDHVVYGVCVGDSNLYAAL